MDLSVVIPSFEAPDHLSACLASLERACLDAPALEVEVIVVDNGSRDDSPRRAMAAARTPRLVAFARNRGFETLFLQCLPENLKMQHVARKFGDHLHFQEGDVEATITSPDPDAISLCSEILEDAGALWQALLRADGLGWPLPACASR